MQGPQTDFYKTIQPFQRDISDLDLHFQRRDSLYRHLGIVPAFIAGCSVIEFGPGHGENALFVLRNRPARLVLVEANESCLDQSRSLLEKHRPDGTVMEYHRNEIEGFPQSEEFNFVICEATLPLQLNPTSLLKSVASFTAPGGVLCITCQDSVSLFAETLRRLMVHLVTDPKASMDARVDRVLPILSPHLETLPGMNRSHRDWIIDQMIHPWTGSMLSIRDAALALQDRFDIYGTSPKFMVDWRWYRDIHGDRAYGALAEECYFLSLHNLLDYRFTHPPQIREDNQQLQALCEKVFHCQQDFERNRNREKVKEIREFTSQIGRLVKRFSPESSTAIEDYLRVLDSYLKDGSLRNFDHFTGFFGRGQQHVSFLRR